MEQDEMKFEMYKKQGILTIQNIDKKSICELISFHHPPPAVLLVLQYVQTIIAGSYHDIEMNPATNQPKFTDWNACRKMACKDSHLFLKTCLEIFDKFGKDSYLDERINQVSKRIENQGTTYENIVKISISCGSLFSWVQNVVQCQKLYQKKH